MKYLFLLLFFNPFFTRAESSHDSLISWSHKSFDQALQSKTYFKFVGTSLKVGFIATEFQGVAKAGKITYRKEKNELNNVKLIVPVSSLDTDNEARNEKMLNKCLRYPKFQEITVKLLAPVDLTKTSQSIPATMDVAGSSLSVTLIFSKEEDHLFSGETTFGLKEANIPDPSIFIAKVKNEIEIRFQVKIQ